jgi:hypothetical protein
VSNHITTNILVSSNRHLLNARIGITVRTLISVEDDLIQPSTIDIDITPEGAQELINQLEQALRLDTRLQEGRIESYIIQHERLTVDGVSYGEYFHYLDGIPLAE